jgi:hypothetical protein
LSTRFSYEADFTYATFSKEADFTDTKFSLGANFYRSTFLSRAYFSGKFNDPTFFNYTIFEEPTKVIFDIRDMSNVSFSDCDITRIRFTDIVKWGGNDGFTIIEEEWLERQRDETKLKQVTLDDVLSVYRNLRENYEFRIRHDDPDMFFIKEMELNRKYRTVYSEASYDLQTKKNDWFRRNIFSFIGWYHLLSNYGASLFRPIITSIIIIFSFYLIFLSQNNTDLVPTFDSNSPLTKNTPISNTTSYVIINNTKIPINSTTYSSSTTNSKFIGLDQFGNITHWRKAFERTIADFLPFLPIPSNITVVLTDYIIKIVGSLITLGLVTISIKTRLSRKFAR